MVRVKEKDAGVSRAEIFDAEAWLREIQTQRLDLNASLLREAWEMAQQAHSGQRRASGEPYIRHALAVAEILVDLQMDSDTIAAAILHDVVEDTSVTLETIERQFGPGVARLVDGVTKIDLIGEYPEHGLDNKRKWSSAESLRKMLLAMAEDVRVVLIKLADRLHNMRTLNALGEEKRRRIARETLDIFAPLANRLGIWQIKWELEDLSFRYLEPETYKRIARLLDERRVDRERYMARVVSVLEGELGKEGIAAQVNGRPKHIYSIWRKMTRKGLDFNQIFDVRAVRVLVDSVAECYSALSIVHSLWKHIPDEYDDYITSPKENMYQSLHTAVIGPEGRTVEVQIRTHEMHEHAELGVAAHWQYKEGARFDSGFEQKVAWLRQILEWKDEESDAGDFIDRFKDELFEDRVYVVTPKGNVMDLPAGSTALDFAYHIHTDVGHRCRGAKVNGQIVPLTRPLRNGDQVEILTTRSGTPSRDWINPHLGYLQTSRARAKVRAWFKQQDQDKNVAAGRTVVDREMHRLGVTEYQLDALARRFDYDKTREFLAAVGRGEISGGQLAGAAQEQVMPARPREEPMLPTRAAPRGETAGEVKIEGVGNLLTKMAGCCRPVPGDSIVGYITRGHGVTIHRQDCANVLRLQDVHRERFVQVSWGLRGDTGYPVDIAISAFDRQGLLRDITALLSNEKVNVLSINTLTDTKDNMAQLDLTMEIRDARQLSRVLEKIGQLPNIIDVRRRKG